MDKNVHIILLIILCISYFDLDYCEQLSLTQKIKTFFQRKSIEKIEQQEVPIRSLCSLSLNNIHGSISIKSGPKKSIFLQSIKRAKTETILDTLSVNVETINTNHLAIFTHSNHKNNSYSIDYELIVPAFLDIAINITGKGTVFVKDLDGAIDIVANNDITVLNTKKRISTQTLKQGSITIIDATGPVEAYTQNGSIIAENITNSFDARSAKGNITVVCKKVPEKSYINLSTFAGNINLALPINTNATIYGDTRYGILLSHHTIRINPYCTKLNKNAWTYFTKHVEGILGNGDAIVHMQSTKGNIKLIETNFT